ncbi:hypothetical protein E2542_SST12240 [Spatholobus suberectus]|nr:hypothetical protein E2542_SST12240 [Spatholobus suberectus]
MATSMRSSSSSGWVHKRCGCSDDVLLLTGRKGAKNPEKKFHRCCNWTDADTRLCCGGARGSEVLCEGTDAPSHRGEDARNDGDCRVLDLPHAGGKKCVKESQRTAARSCVAAPML